MKVDVDPDDIQKLDADGRGRVYLGTEYADTGDIEVAVLNGDPAEDKVVKRLADTMSDLDTAKENAPEITEDRRCPEDDHVDSAIADAHMKIEEAISILRDGRDPRANNE